MLSKALLRNKRSLSSVAARAVITPPDGTYMGIPSYDPQITASQRDPPRFSPFSTLYELGQVATADFGDRPRYGAVESGARTFGLDGTPDESGRLWASFNDCNDMVDRARGALVNMGVKPGDRVAIISRNHLAWPAVAHAAWSLGAVLVPMYEQQLAKDWHYILKDSGASVVVASRGVIYDEVKPWTSSIDSLEHVVCFDDSFDHTGGTLDSFVAMMNADGAASAPSAIPPMKDDMGVLMYTSGTTGNPKGVMLSHENICSNTRALLDFGSPEAAEAIGGTLSRGDDVSLAFLPWAHIYGQTLEMHCGHAAGFASAIVEDTANVAVDLPLVRPTLLFSVPTLYKRIYDGLNAKIPTEAALASGVKKAEAEAKQESLGAFDNFKHNMLDKIVLSKIRDRFGGRLRASFSGGASLAPEVMDFVNALGIPVNNGYGLTETSPVCASGFLGEPHKQVKGGCGVALPGTRCSIRSVADESEVEDGIEGELWVAGPHIMQGYWNNTEATEEVIREEDGVRWFRTGDLATKAAGDAYGNVSITGRLKEQYKLENGKYVAPAPLEETLCLNSFVTQAILYGDNEVFNVALIVPDIEQVRKWADEAKSPEAEAAKAAVAGAETEAQICELPAVKDLLLVETKKALAGIKKYEIPKNVAVVEAFTAERGMLTPKLSIKRPIVVKHYAETIEGLYGRGGLGGKHGLVDKE
ncbi:hypothetical protein TL16_g08395 [Triparma laevis f. inornata]|uniref:AMP-dependent synthetase/ligase domain-containing protein n=1 Tax=Triparma laevis f. inornata TaxID=1714386 RepID=A0A9W7AXF1_9STRA|nr:hypothetical protein TL16_g08395 [Triparma laevis f. inornata]